MVRYGCQDTSCYISAGNLLIPRRLDDQSCNKPDKSNIRTHEAGRSRARRRLCTCRRRARSTGRCTRPACRRAHSSRRRGRTTSHRRPRPLRRCRRRRPGCLGRSTRRPNEARRCSHSPGTCLHPSIRPRVFAAEEVAVSAHVVVVEPYSHMVSFAYPLSVTTRKAGWDLPVPKFKHSKLPSVNL
jgi:hypothetical protein